MIQEKKLTSIRINKTLYAHLQKKAKKENRSVNNYIETLLYENSDYNEPNEETIAAIEQAEIDRKTGNYEVIKDIRKFLEEVRDGEV